MNFSQKDPDDTNNVALAYDSPSWWYDIRGYFILRLTYRARLKSLLTFFSQNLGQNHLEVAVGSGTFLYLLLKENKRNMPVTISAFDYAPSMLSGAVKRFNNMSNIAIIKADVANLPYESNAFDSINIANAIHCFSHADEAFLELFRVLKKEGTLAGNVLLYPSGNVLSRWIASHINQWGIKKGVLFKPYSTEEIKEKITKAGFVILKEEFIGNMYNFIARKA